MNNKNLPIISDYFQSREPSAIRAAQIVFNMRKEKPVCVNTAIGNVSLQMHPAMQKRMFNLKNSADLSIREGRIMYSSTCGLEDAKQAFLNIIASGGFKTKGLNVQITDGGSEAMEYMVLGVCGSFGGKEKPLLVFDPAYTNYRGMVERTRRKLVSAARVLRDDGSFSLPDIKAIREQIKKYRPGAMLVIPYDNPTGQFFTREMMIAMAELCVKNNMWMVSDEAYRYMYYGSRPMSSIWGITDKEVPGIEGRRIGIDSASKLFNACGLRIGAIITDNKQFHDKALFEGTSNLCAPVIDQYIFGALSELSAKKLREWYKKQRNYYKPIMQKLTADLVNTLPGIIVSKPEAAIYSVIDVKNIAKPGFDAMDFVMYSAKEGKVNLNGKNYTLLTSPMAGFYNVEKGKTNPGKTQMRIAFVEPPEKMVLAPKLFKALFEKYES